MLSLVSEMAIKHLIAVHALSYIIPKAKYFEKREDGKKSWLLSKYLAKCDTLWSATVAVE